MDHLKKAMARAKAEGNKAIAEVSATDTQVLASQASAGTTLPSYDYIYTKKVTIAPAQLRANRIFLGDEDNAASVSYKLLRTQVIQKLKANNWRTLAVTSTLSGEGKTLSAINLAISIARDPNHTVLLVDFNLRHPSIHQYFGFVPALGLSDYLLYDAPLQDMMINPGVPDLVILPGREAIFDSSETLASQKVVELVQELRSRYASRVIIFDLPAVLHGDDMLTFSPNVDAALFVIEEGTPKREQVESALELLKQTQVMGTLLNRSENNKVKI